MIENKVIANVDNIISIEFKKEEPHYSNSGYTWMDVFEVWEKENPLYFWKPKTKRLVGGCYVGGYYGNQSILSLKDVIDNNSCKLVKTGALGEGPDGTIFSKSTVIIKTIGGKYTNDYYNYFDSDKEALNFLKEFEDKYPGKFTIVR
jgi:hypothetical protein